MNKKQKQEITRKINKANKKQKEEIREEMNNKNEWHRDTYVHIRKDIMYSVMLLILIIAGIAVCGYGALKTVEAGDKLTNLKCGAAETPIVSPNGMELGGTEHKCGLTEPVDIPHTAIVSVYIVFLLTLVGLAILMTILLTGEWMVD